MANENLDQFNRELHEFIQNIPKDAVVFQKRIVLEALRRIVLRTPVDTGRARGNWQTAIGQPLASQLDTLDKAGQETIDKGLQAIAELPPYSVVWISNNVDYIEFLEAGSSKQAPAGMVSITVEELRQMFQ